MTVSAITHIASGTVCSDLRWSAWIDAMKRGYEKPVDFYSIDEAWVNDHSSYELADSSEALPTALEILKKL